MKYRVMSSYSRLFALIIAKLGLFVTCFSLGMAIAAPTPSKKQASTEVGLKMVATIRPVYSLLAALTQGVSQPTLLIKHQASPHHYSLRPSEKRLIKEANLIFWIGPELETFLPTVLATIPSSHHAIRLDKSPEILQLPIRTGKAWESYHDHAHSHHHEQHAGAALDPHVWLSPDNAAKMAVYMATILIEYDPMHRTQYEHNLKKLIVKLDDLQAEIKAQLKNVQAVPFLVFHDGYQYFEEAYHLHGVGAISINPELPMSSRRLESVQEKIQRLKVACVFSEPQWGTHLVDVLADKYGIGIGMLDPLGAETPDPTEDYFVNLRALSKAMSDCLSKNKKR